jgi:hypothetical protein
VSTIEGRRADRGSHRRIRKLVLQARYSWLNMMAVRERDARVSAAGRTGPLVPEWPARQDVV